MTQVERRILTLEFDNHRFELGIRSTMDTLDQFERKLEMKHGTDGLDNIERKVNGFTFRNMEKGIEDTSDKFNALNDTATDSLTNIEQTSEHVGGFKGLVQGVHDTAMQFLELGNRGVDSLAMLAQAQKDLSMQDAAGAVDALAAKFDMLGIVGMSVINRLTNAAIDLGGSILGKVINPIVEGGFNRAMAVERARFTLQGLISDGDELNQILTQAQDSVTGTAYGMDDAATAVASLAATGMRSGKELQTVLAGIAGTAATTNSQYSEIAHIFTTVAGNGRLMGEQLNQLSYRGLNVAATLRDSFNQVLDGTSKLDEGMQEHIRNIVEEGSKSIDQFQGSLEEITEGDIRELVSRGKVDFETFASIMGLTFGEHAKDANKTFDGSMANIQAALKRTGEMFYKGLIVQEGPVVQMFNAIRVAINAVNAQLQPLADLWTVTINTIAGSIAQLITVLSGTDEEVNDAKKGVVEFKDAVIGIKNVVDSVVSVLGAFVAAVSRVFLGFQDLADLKEGISEFATAFKNWSETIKPTDEQIAILTSNFEGLLSIIKIVGTIFGSIIATIFRLLGALAPLGWEILKITGNLGEALLAFSDFLTSSQLLARIGDTIIGIFSTIGNVLAGLLTGIRLVADIFGEFVSNLSLMGSEGSEVGGIINRIASAFEKFSHPAEFASEKLERLSAIFDKLMSKLRELGKLIEPIAEKIKEFFASLTFDQGISLVNTGIFAALLATMLNILGRLKKYIAGGGGIGAALNSFGDSLLKLANDIKNFQTNLNPDALIKIAVAIGILAASMVLISQLDPAQLATGIAGISALFAELAAGMYAFATLTDVVKFTPQLRTLAVIMVLMAGSIAILSIALVKIAQLEPQQIARGLIGIGAALAIMVKGMTGLSSLSGNMAKVGAQLILLAIALNLLVIPVKALSELSMKELTKGLGGLFGIVALLAAAVSALDKVKIKMTTAVSLLLIAQALTMLVGVAEQFKTFSVESIVKSELAILGLLTMLGAFVSFVKPQKIFMVSVSMLLIAESVKQLVEPIERIGKLSIETIGKGLLFLAATLGALIVTLKVLKPADLLIVGVAINLLAVAITSLSDVVEKLAGIPWPNIAFGMGALAVLLVSLVGASKMMQGSMGGALALSVFALALTPLCNTLVTLSSIPLEHVAVGLGAIAATFVILGVAAKLLGPLTPQIIALAGAFTLVGISCLAIGVGLGVAAAGFAMLIAVFAANGAVLMAYMKQMASMLPYFAEMVATAVTTMLTKFAEMSSSITDALTSLGSAVLTTFQNLIPQFVEVILEFVSAIAQSLAEHAPELAESFLTFITGILEAIAANIGPIAEAGLLIVTNFINGIAEGLPGVIDAAFNLVVSFVNGLAEAIRNNHEPLFDAIKNLVSAIVEAIRDGVSDVIDAGLELIGGFFEGIFGSDPIGQLQQFGSDLINGFIEGVESMLGAAASSVADFFGSIVDNVAGLLGIASPSTVFFGFGDNTAQGWIDGFLAREGDAGDAGSGFADTIITAFSDTDYAAKNAGNKTATSMLNGLASKTKDYATTGQTQASTYARGVSSQTSSASKSGTALSKSAINSVSSYTKSFSSTGSSAGSNYASGINSKTSSASSAGAGVGRSGRSGAGGISWYGTGQDAADGYKRGINSMVGSVSRAAASLASSALLAAKNAQNSSSPSKEFMKLGTYAGQGYELGMINHISAVSKASANMASSAIQVANDILSDIDFDADIDPVITPVVDLSGVNAAKRTIEGIFNNTDIFYGLESSVQGIGLSSNFRTATMLPDISGSSQTNNETVINVQLNYDAGADANQMARDIARSVKRYQLARGV